MVDQRLLAARETGEASLRSPRTSRLRSLTGPPTKRGRKKKTTSTPADVSSPRKVNSPSLLASPVSPRSPRLFQHFRSSKTPKQVRRSSVDTVDTAETDTAVGVVGWLRDQCPDDVLPKVLAFCAPSTAAALKRTCRYFYDILNQEETWKVLCEEHYKWTPDQEMPSSWFDYYRTHPCVPTDYRSVHRALAAVAGSKRVEQSVTILLRPGQHCVSKAITIDAVNRMIGVSLETIQLPAQCYQEDAPRRAVLTSKMRRRNEPMFRVLQGELSLKDLHLQHSSSGIDIWAGNAAVHIRPVDGVMAHPSPDLPRASVTMSGVEVESGSGRGIVVMGDSRLTMTDSFVHDCAATGIYIGGAKTTTVLQGCDVTNNGTGNYPAGGIARGHSGIYLEQGRAVLRDCNVSHNSSAGISVISPLHSYLALTMSDILANGGTPLELPIESIHRHELECNRIEVVGVTRPRSALYQHHIAQDDEDDDSEWGEEEDDGDDSSE